MTFSGHIWWLCCVENGIHCSKPFSSCWQCCCCQTCKACRMSPSNVPHLGYSVKESETSKRRVAYLESTELYSLTSSESRKLCLLLLAGKSLVAARVDFTRQDPTGNTGIKLYDLIVRKLNLSYWKDNITFLLRKVKTLVEFLYKWLVCFTFNFSSNGHKVWEGLS